MDISWCFKYFYFIDFFFSIAKIRIANHPPKLFLQKLFHLRHRYFHVLIQRRFQLQQGSVFIGYF